MNDAEKTAARYTVTVTKNQTVRGETYTATMTKKGCKTKREYTALSAPTAVYFVLQYLANDIRPYVKVIP